MKIKKTFAKSLTAIMSKANERHVPFSNIEVIAMPKRQRHLATMAMASKAPLQIAKHMMLVTCLPNAKAQKHWKKEIKAFLRDMQFDLSEFSVLDPKNNRKRVIKEMHYYAKDLIEKLNDLTADAMLILEGGGDYDNEEFVPPKNLETGNLFDYGWELKEFEENGRIIWELWYKNELIADVP